MHFPAAGQGRSLLKTLARLAVVAAFAATACPALSADRQVQWQGVDRVVAFADVHGAYAELTGLLQSVGVVDAKLRWSGGKTHLVSLGDLLDRGADSRKVMDLLMRLQQEAAAAGGAVHVVIGNHEAMNVLGDLRYVDKGEFAAYVAEEDPAFRAARRTEFLARQAGTTDADFERLFPPGYFGHGKLLGPDGTYGQWILSQPVAIVVNDTIYMHGGPSAALGERGIDALDRDYAAALANYLSAVRPLRDAGLLQFEDPYGGRAEAAQSRLDAMPSGEAKSALQGALGRFKAADDDPLLGPSGPNWDRGAAFCNECAEADVLRPFLQRTGTKRLVIGHTVARDGTVVSRFDGAVVKLDAGMNHAVYKGRPAALVIDATGSRVAYANPTVAPATIPEEPIYLSSQALPEDQVAAILERGEVRVTETCAPGVLGVQVALEQKTVNAVFEVATDEVVEREVAAYELDRLLGLGLVPATVARSHNGKDGVLQGRPAGYVSEKDRQNARSGAREGLVCQTISDVPQAVPARRPVPADGRASRMPSGGWCNVTAQVQLAYAFDALMGNRGRTLDRFLFDTDTSNLFLSGHALAFPHLSQLSEERQQLLARTGPEMQSRLAALDKATLEGALGRYLNPDQIRAILARRDRILELARGR